MSFGKVLRQLRSEYHMTQKQFADILGVSESTIGMYERGKREPDFETMGAIADYFHVDMDYLHGRSEARLSAPLANITREIDPIYDALNPAGRKELCRYGRYLTGQDDYKAEGAAPQIEYIRHYLTAAAAGYAAPIDGEDYELIPRDGSVPAKADFCIDIDGDSMEPYIKNGQRVYVQQGVTLQEFDVGVFFVDGDVYCKQWCTDYVGTLHLLSANPKREDANLAIPRDSVRSVVCFGKVLLPKKLPRPIYP